MDYNKTWNRPEADHDYVMNHNVSKVYINPNFNRTSALNSLPTKKCVVHVNPKFSHQAQNSYQNNTNMKVYINPNFLKSNDTLNREQFVKSCYVNKTSYDKTSEPIIGDNCGQFSVTDQILSERNNILTVPQQSKTKYSLVRNNQHRCVPVVQPINKNTNTIQLNKYKSVPISDIKKNISVSLKPVNKPIKSKLAICRQMIVHKYKKYVNCTTPNIYKLINKSKGDITVNSEIRTPNKQVFIKKMPQSNYKTKLKTPLGKYKKNNIPCPLYRKYGKCLRSTKGICEFLHDKKHVTICRKFLKGICHNKECLLAHDLTIKKMPTCYFYLKGICTKDNCPYLHVKLNEKAEICPDFLRGYCENGKECLKRHINVCPDMATKGVTIKRPKGKNKGLKSEHVNMKVKTRKFEADKQQTQENDAPDGRYYNERAVNVETVDESSQVMKPSRCKLGILPSFIKL